MTKLTIIFIIVFMVVLERAFYYAFLKPPPLPEVQLDEWWGPEALKGVTEDIKPFKVHFSNELILNLKERLKGSTDFTSPLEGVAFNYGFNTNVLQEYLQYWAKDYNFTEREAYFNQYPQFKTNIQGLDIHFVRVTPQERPGTVRVPILLLHGWPGSHLEFFETIPFFTERRDRDFQLELIIPNLPGFGYSSGAVRPGLGPNEMAVVLRNLMHRLGFRQFYVQGGDFGSVVGSAMSTLFPNEVLGFHTNMAYVAFSPHAKLLELLGSLYPSLVVETRLADRMYPLSTRLSLLLQESGYFHQQATKPDTVGVALVDSPAGLLAYMLEKFSTGTNPSNLDKEDGGLVFPKDQLIDNVMVYWTGKCMTTAMRIYAEVLSIRHISARMDEIPTPVPTWALQAKYEIFYQPPFILRFKYPNLVNVTVLDDGGHFIALEKPEILANDVLKAVTTFRSNKRSN